MVSLAFHLSRLCAVRQGGDPELVARYDLGRRLSLYDTLKDPKARQNRRVEENHRVGGVICRGALRKSLREALRASFWGLWGAEQVIRGEAPKL